MCTCLRNVDRQLADNGARVATIPMRRRADKQRAPRVIVKTVNHDPLDKRHVLAVATHCPFCGTRYED